MAFEEIWQPILDFINNNIARITTSLVILVIGYIVIKIVNFAISKSLGRVKFDKSLKTFVTGVVRVILWVILFVMLLANFGVNVSALVAGLGIAGFVIGFALQDTLGNLAAGVFILYHKPFKVDDWINIDGIVGGVERIGIAACTLSAPDGVKITIPNSKIWGGTIQNYTGNPVRKLFNLDIAISYSSDIGKAIKIINDILKKDKRVLEDPAPKVVVKSLGDSSVNIAVRPAVSKDDYWDLYFDLVRNIKEQFDKKKIVIPFPQRDVHIKKR